jgi:hypothetical protein
MGAANLLPHVQDNDVRGGVRTEDNGAVTVGDLVRDAYAKDKGVAAHAVKKGIETNVMHELCHVLHQVSAALEAPARRKASRECPWRNSHTRCGCRRKRSSPACRW